MSANPMLHSRTKHFELDLFFVRENVIQKQVDVRHIPSLHQIADLLTKALSSTRFLNLTKNGVFSHLEFDGGC